MVSQTSAKGIITNYDYDDHNRLTEIDYSDSTADVTFAYDANGNLGGTVKWVVYDNNGNMQADSDSLINQWDAANRLISTSENGNALVNHYDGLGNRVARTVDGQRTDYALDVQGLPEVLYTSEGNRYLHLPGLIVTESASGETRYLLSDGLGSVRHVVDEYAEIVSYQEFDPYGKPILNSSILN